MTVRELQQLHYLGRLIEREKERLEDLRSAVSLKSPVLTDMPKAPGVRDRIGDVVPEIVDQEAEIIRNLKRYAEERDRLQAYIDRTPNHRMRLILSLRFMDQLPWQEVADRIGGRETEYSVKQACYRYVEGRAEPEWLRQQISIFDENQKPQ